MADEVTPDEMADLGIPDQQKFPQLPEPEPWMCGVVNPINGRYCMRKSPHPDQSHCTYDEQSMMLMKARKERRSSIKLVQILQEMLTLASNAAARGDALIRLAALKGNALLSRVDDTDNQQHVAAVHPADLKLRLSTVGTGMLLLGQFSSGLYMLAEAATKIKSSLRAFDTIAALDAFKAAIEGAERETLALFNDRIAALRKDPQHAQRPDESLQEFERRLHKTATEQIVAEAKAEAARQEGDVRPPE